MAWDETDPQIRRLEHMLELAAQACRARRRSTGIARWVRDWRTPQPQHLDTPFERRFLLDAHDVLDELAARLLAPVVDVRRRGSEVAPEQAVAEPA